MTMTFREAANLLGQRDRKKIGNNRWLSYRKKIGNNRWLSWGLHYWIDPTTGESWIVDADDPRGARRSIKVTLNKTPVVKILEGDFYIVNAGGWRTRATQAAINEIIPSHVWIRTNGDEWYITRPWNGPMVEFHDHMTLGPDGDPLEYTSEVM